MAVALRSPNWSPPLPLKRRPNIATLQTCAASTTTTTAEIHPLKRRHLDPSALEAPPPRSTALEPPPPRSLRPRSAPPNSPALEARRPNPPLKHRHSDLPALEALPPRSVKPNLPH
ncbi:hypothetical protein Salat_2567300 [Sesamum alatum]|uniref:Uncharacterized protein n=1 Tax=Sesamum alatum TaxID=300844 RepID=A0AAE1XTM9_9LAMI|nr:hypothetical protein Salat_2567300 [Sesamum alatum]